MRFSASACLRAAPRAAAVALAVGFWLGSGGRSAQAAPDAPVEYRAVPDSDASAGPEVADGGGAAADEGEDLRGDADLDARRDGGTAENPPEVAGTPATGASGATAPPAAPAAPAPGWGDGVELTEAERSHVVEVARGGSGYRRLRVSRVGVIALDCSGFVRAVYLSLGLDLFATTMEGGGGGVGMIRRYVEAHGRNWPVEPGPGEAAYVPRPGDAVYFHNTHDRNHNRRRDDLFTHVGFVDHVDDDGTIHFLHASKGVPVRMARMNFRYPHVTRDPAGKIVNHVIRLSRHREPPDAPRLAVELFAGFGAVGRSPASGRWRPEAAPVITGAGRFFPDGPARPGHVRGGSKRRPPVPAPPGRRTLAPTRRSVVPPQRRSPPPLRGGVPPRRGLAPR